MRDLIKIHLTNQAGLLLKCKFLLDYHATSIPEALRCQLPLVIVGFLMSSSFSMDENTRVLRNAILHIIRQSLLDFYLTGLKEIQLDLTTV